MNSLPYITAPHVPLPDHRLLVIDEEYWIAFFNLIKEVEFRVDTTLEAGMFVLFAMGASQRRSGLTGLLLAEVREVCTLPIKEACRKFPREAKACSLRTRWGRSTVACIMVQNVRLAPEFVMLGQGNLSALRQFSIKHCCPQFCHVTDLGRTVTVEHRGQTVQRTICIAPCGMAGKKPAGFVQSSRGHEKVLMDAVTPTVRLASRTGLGSQLSLKVHPIPLSLFPRAPAHGDGSDASHQAVRPKP